MTSQEGGRSAGRVKEKGTRSASECAVPWLQTDMPSEIRLTVGSTFVLTDRVGVAESMNVDDAAEVVLAATLKRKAHEVLDLAAGTTSRLTCTAHL